MKKEREREYSREGEKKTYREKHQRNLEIFVQSQRHLGAILVDPGALQGHLGAILESLVGNLFILRLSWTTLGHVGQFLSHLGPFGHLRNLEEFLKSKTALGAIPPLGHKCFWSISQALKNLAQYPVVLPVSMGPFSL